VSVSIPHIVTKACRDLVAATPGNAFEMRLKAAPDIEAADAMPAGTVCIVFPATYAVEPLTRTTDLHTVGVGIALFKRIANDFTASEDLGKEADDVRRYLSRKNMTTSEGVASYVSTDFAGALDATALREQNIGAIYMTATYQISTI
jgi:hypothetical protein